MAETLALLLCRCSRTKAFHHGPSLHAAAIKTGIRRHVVISNHILNMYAKCGRTHSASQVFNEMDETNLVTWSAMISGYSQAGEHLMALQMFAQMPLSPNEFIIASVLSSCAKLSALELGKQIHAQSVKLGYSSVPFVFNSLMSMYMKSGQSEDALSVFSDIHRPNDVSYNAIIAGLVDDKQPEKAFEMFKLMCRQGLVPDRFTFVGLLGCCSTLDNLNRRRELHCLTVKLKLDSTSFIGNVLVTMYSKLNLIEEAEKIFWFIREKDVISWNTIIAACCHCNEHVKALNVFQRMLNFFCASPDNFTYASILSASACLASLRHGRQIHAHLIRANSDGEIVVENALLNMYAKCGCIRYACIVFNHIHCRNLVSWNSIIVGFANHGLGEKALELFKQMKKTGLKPDSVTFLGLLIACNHAGLVDEGKAFFSSMDELHGITPDIEHFSCLIDLLGRAGRLGEAEQYLRKSSFGNDLVVLGCLLSACRLHGDILIGEHLVTRLLELQPTTTSPYVLVSSLYASDLMWGSVAEARKMLKGSGLKKEPGCSLIDVKGYAEKFTRGDFSHSRIEEILGTLRCLCSAGNQELFHYF